MREDVQKIPGPGSARETAEIWASRALDKTAGTEKRGEEGGAGPGPRILDFLDLPGPKNPGKLGKSTPWEVLFLLFSLQGTLFPAPM